MVVPAGLLRTGIAARAFGRSTIPVQNVRGHWHMQLSIRPA